LEIGVFEYDVCNWIWFVVCDGSCVVEIYCVKRVIRCVEMVWINCESVFVSSVESMDLILWGISIVVTECECMFVCGF